MVRLTIATAYTATTPDPAVNGRRIAAQMRAAKRRGADLVQFPECALAGYVPSDRRSYDDLDWNGLEARTRALFDLAASLRIWLLLGSVHRLSGSRPHNSVYVVDDRGCLIDRYDKRFCAGPPDESAGELATYCPGDHPVVFEINGVRCGVLICYEFRFPELYREYEQAGVRVLFHSFHAAGLTQEVAAEHRALIGERAAYNEADSLPGITMPAAVRSAASSNNFWISASNSAARQSCWPSFVVRPDGVTTGRLRRNVPGVLVTRIDTDADHYDSTRHWRGRAMAGRLHSGTLPDDPRSRDRSGL